MTYDILAGLATLATALLLGRLLYRLLDALWETEARCDYELPAFRSCRSPNPPRGRLGGAFVVLAGDEQTQILVRLPVDLLQAMRARAEDEDRSIAATIRCALRLYLENTK